MYRRFFNLRLQRRGSSCLPQLRRYRSWICYREVLSSFCIPSKIDTASWPPIMNLGPMVPAARVWFYWSIFWKKYFARMPSSLLWSRKRRRKRMRTGWAKMTELRLRNLCSHLRIWSSIHPKSASCNRQLTLGFQKPVRSTSFLITSSSPGQPRIRAVGYHRRWLTHLSHTNAIEVAESARHARQTNTEMPRDADSLPINLGVCPDRYDCV